MTITNKLKNNIFIITVSFYICLLIIPYIVQKDIATSEIYRNFFFSRTLNIILCIVPAGLCFLFSKNDFRNKSLILAGSDALILFLIFSEFFTSAANYLNMLIAVFIIMFVLINTNEYFAAAGIIPFFFLSKLDIFLYAITVAVPLIILLIIKLTRTENKIKKIIMQIVLFVQCYTLVLFTFMIITKRYHINTAITTPQAITAAYIAKTVAAILLMLLVAVCHMIKTIGNSRKITEKLLFSASAVIPVCLGIAGYFTDIFSVSNRTAIVIAIINIIIFTAQHSISAEAEIKKNKDFTEIITIACAVLFCLSI